MECIDRSIEIENCGIILVGISSDYIQNMILCSETENMPIYKYIDATDNTKLPSHLKYKIYVDPASSHAYKTTLNILNTILTHSCQINIYLVGYASKNVNCKLFSMLTKLRKHGFISVSDLIINTDSPAPHNNVVFFLSPGDSGRSSLIAAISKKCIENKKSVALIDLSKTQKLTKYLNISTEIDNHIIKRIDTDFIIKNTNNHLYTYLPSISDRSSEIIYLCEFITKLSSMYDFVFISADEGTVVNMHPLFKIGSKHIAILDSQPQNSVKVRAMALRLMLNGINTKNTLSVIYNRISTSGTSIRDIEERTFFIRLPKRKLLSILGMDSPTIEIPFEKNISKSIKYRRAIGKIYMHVNDIPYIDDDEKDIIEYIKEIFKQLKDWHLIKNMLSHAKDCNWAQHLLSLKKQL